MKMQDRFGRKVRIEPKIPTASMADLAFLLLIFFMATTIFKLEEGLEVHLPKAIMGEKLPREMVSHIWINAAGKISIDDKIVMVTEIEPVIAQKWRENPGMIVGFKTDQNVPYRIMDQAMEQLKRANALSVAFNTDKKLRGGQ
jgi:biopolymer transport protein ExbD